MQRKQFWQRNALSISGIALAYLVFTAFPAGSAATAKGLPVKAEREGDGIRRTATREQGTVSLWVDPRSVDLSDPAVIQNLTSQPVNRLIVSVFTGGQTLHTSRVPLFPQMAAYREKPDALATLIEAAQKRNIRVYAAVDLFQWMSAGATAREDIFQKHPDMAERTSTGDYGIPVEGAPDTKVVSYNKYASPFHQEAEGALRGLAAELGEKYPTLGGLVLEVRFPRTVLLGYSDAARAAYIRKSQIDPIDLPTNGDPEKMTGTKEWAAWRIQYVDTLMGRIATAFRAGSKRPVAAIGFPYWYRAPIGAQSRTLTDWKEWLRSGTVDEVILEDPWKAGERQSAFEYARTVVAPDKTEARLTPLINLTADPTDTVKPEDIVGALRAQGAANIVFRLSRPGAVVPTSR